MKHRLQFINLLLIGLLFLTGCAFHIVGLDETTEAIRDVTLAATCFHAEHRRWPASQEELSSFAADADVPFDETRFELLTITPQDDGRCKIEYSVVPLGDCSNFKGTLSLGKPTYHE